MSLEKYKDDMDVCNRCSLCKFIPLEQIKGYDRVQCCPSIQTYNFNAYSGGGKLNLAMSILDGRIKPDEKVSDIVFKCQMCGACDVSCKYALDMEVMDPLYELRFYCTEHNAGNPVLNQIVQRFRKNGHVSLPVKKNINATNCKKFPKEMSQILYFPGCRTSESVMKASMELLKTCEVDFSIPEEDLCCGGRIYEMGYRKDFEQHITKLNDMINGAGVKKVITSCAECYYTLSVLTVKMGLTRHYEVRHITMWLDEMIQQQILKPRGLGTVKVTYQDPCHLGRKGEPYQVWNGKKKDGHCRVYDPPKEFRRGEFGCYDAPRRILNAIPGVELLEMQRIKEYAWCCGSGGGVKESSPYYYTQTAKERLREAVDTGAQYIITACPGCQSTFNDISDDIRAIDIVEFLDILL